MNTTTKFTPGPFQIIEDDVWDTRSDGEPGIPLARANYGCDRLWGRKISREEASANMTLFAAAPELVEALEIAVTLWAFQSTDAPQKEWLRIADAALAKARGER